MDIEEQTIYLKNPHSMQAPGLGMMIQNGRWAPYESILGMFSVKHKLNLSSPRREDIAHAVTDENNQVTY